MSQIAICLEPMHLKFTHDVCQLFIAQFRTKFKVCQTINDTQLREFFKKQIEDLLLDPSTHQIVAVCDDKVIGSLCMAWKPESNKPRKELSLFSKEMATLFGKWNFSKFWFSLHQLKHVPQFKECYIKHLLVHPEYQEKNVETLLVQWANDFAHKDSRFDLLTVHLTGKDQNTTRLYEKFFFKTCLRKNSLVRSFIFDDSRWNFLTLSLK